MGMEDAELLIDPLLRRQPKPMKLSIWLCELLEEASKKNLWGRTHWPKITKALSGVQTQLHVGSSQRKPKNFGKNGKGIPEVTTVFKWPIPLS